MDLVQEKGARGDFRVPSLKKGEPLVCLYIYQQTRTLSNIFGYVQMQKIMDTKNIHIIRNTRYSTHTHIQSHTYTCMYISVRMCRIPYCKRNEGNKLSVFDCITFTDQ